MLWQDRPINAAEGQPSANEQTNVFQLAIPQLATIQECEESPEDDLDRTCVSSTAAKACVTPDPVQPVVVIEIEEEQMKGVDDVRAPNDVPELASTISVPTEPMNTGVAAETPGRQIDGQRSLGAEVDDQTDYMIISDDEDDGDAVDANAEATTTSTASSSMALTPPSSSASMQIIDGPLSEPVEPVECEPVALSVATSTADPVEPVTVNDVDDGERQLNEEEQPPEPAIVATVPELAVECTPEPMDAGVAAPSPRLETVGEPPLTADDHGIIAAMLLSEMIVSQMELECAPADSDLEPVDADVAPRLETDGEPSLTVDDQEIVAAMLLSEMIISDEEDSADADNSSPPGTGPECDRHEEDATMMAGCARSQDQSHRYGKTCALKCKMSNIQYIRLH